MKRRYGLRVRVEDNSVALDYRAGSTFQWIRVGRLSFRDEDAAWEVYAELKSLLVPPHIVRDSFQSWGCEIPQVLKGREVVLTVVFL